MELTFLGGASEVGASCTLLKVAGRTLLIDGGMRPAAREGQSRIPDLALLDPYPPEAILVTHAHIDHTGALPLIASRYPDIPIYATESTRLLTEVLLRDSVRIMEQEQLLPDGETPLYSSEQVDTLLARIHPVALQQPFAPLPSSPDITVYFIPAGHILGAAMLYFQTPEGTFLHSGDISVTDQRTIKGLNIPDLPTADVMLCEGTYGNRLHTDRKEEVRALVETVQAVIGRGGRILCPAFAVGRAQEIILILKDHRISQQISPIPLYLDGMVRSVCTVYQNQSHDLRSRLQRYQTNARRPLFADPSSQIFAVRTHDRPKLVKSEKPAVIISSSGMLTGGASPLYATEIAKREQDCILFTGYQDEESPGAALLAARQGDTLRIGTQSMQLNCQIKRYNLSGHADAEQITEVVNQVRPRQLILVHGAPEALGALSSRFPKIQVDIPVVGTKITTRQVETHRSSTQAKNLLARHVQSLEVADELPPPTLHDLWAIAVKRGPLRAWTAVELGQHYYGQRYRPVLRPHVEQALSSAVTHFRTGRLGAQTTFQPRSEAEKEQLLPMSRVTAGDIVLVQAQHADPQIAYLLSAPENGAVTLVGDQWKLGQRQIYFIQLLPGIRREDWLALPPQEIKPQLQSWRKQVDGEWIDLFALWRQRQGRDFTFNELRAETPSEDQRLKWGLELLTHGKELFQRNGMTWTPLEEEAVQKNAGFAHHLRLLVAGAGSPVQVNQQMGTLTGRSNWRLFEINWDEKKNEDRPASARATNIELLEQI